ncbi:MAG: phage portal protein [Oscillospiraceae bacterium]|nr:phage portal protein [Oscillospiraceae bacterium]
MLTDLSWLESNSAFPPVQEKIRLDEYRKNDILFNSQVPPEWSTDFKSIARRLGKKQSEIDTIFNYHQLISKKTADFVCGEPPAIETEQDTDKITKKLENQEFFTKLYEAFIDVSRFGNAVLKFRDKTVTAVSPMYWFPICDKSDLKTISQHVIAYPVNPNKDDIPQNLYVEIHEKGHFTERLYSFNGNATGGLIDEKTHITGLDDFAVQILTNVTSSSGLFGISDYSIINSIVEKLIWRFSCIDNVLDKHSEPSMSGPASAMDYDEETGLHFLNLGKYFARSDKNSPDLRYITWDGNLESSFKETEILFNQLYILSEMGQAFADAGGGDSSGTALKLRLVSPRVKAARLAKLNNSRVKNIICTLCSINGISIDYDSLTLHWNDGLPVDETEKIQTLALAVQNKIISQYSAMKRLGLSDSEVQAEIEQINEEQSAIQPLTLGVINNAENTT